MPFSFKINFKDSFYKLSRRTRIVVLSTAGVVFFILFCVAVWNRYFADTLIDYASPQTAVYLHFNLPKVKSTDSWDKTLQKIFQDNGLSGFDLSLIDRETALLGRIDSEKISWILLVKTNEAKKMEKILLDKKARFRFLSFNKVAIFNAEAEEVDLVKNRKNPVKTAVKNKFFGPDNLAVFASSNVKNLLAGDSLSQLLFASFVNADGNFFLTGRLNGGSLLVFPPQLTAPKLKSEKNISADPDISVFLSFNNINKLIDGKIIWPRLDEEMIKKTLSGRIVFWQKDGMENAEKVFSKDFSLCLEQTGQTEAIENILLSLAAKKFPREKTGYLSDRTKFVELVADPERFSWQEKGGVKSLTLSGKDLGAYYQKQGDRILIGSQKENLDPALCGFDQDYLKIKTKELPQGYLWDYFRKFEILESTGQVWKLK